MPSAKKIAILLGGFVVGSEVIWRCYCKFFRAGCAKSTKSNQSGSTTTANHRPINEVLFFNDNGASCRAHANFTNPCMPSCPIGNLNKVVEYLSSATQNLDVCVYFLTCSSLVKAILELKRRGVIVRIITDDESQGNDASQVLNMRRAGCMVRSRKMDNLMHHKFAIIDNQLLITGSANWTRQAFFGNFENIIITNTSDIVQAFKKEFEIMWLKFSNEA